MVINYTSKTGYPQNWPLCPECGQPTMDGKVTCGRSACGGLQSRHKSPYRSADARMEDTSEPLPHRQDWRESAYERDCP